MPNFVVYKENRRCYNGFRNQKIDLIPNVEIDISGGDHMYMQSQGTEFVVAGRKKADAATKKRLAELSTLVGTNIRLERKERGFTTEVLAEFLGISPAYIGLIERGERCPSLETFLRICEFFGERPEEMLRSRGIGLGYGGEEAFGYIDEGTEEKSKRVKSISGMLTAFSIEELGHIFEILKVLRGFSHAKNQPHHN